MNAKEFKQLYGLRDGVKIGHTEYVIISKEEWKSLRSVFEAKRSPFWDSYNSSLIDMHIANCGYGILDGTRFDAVDNEFELSQVYSSIELAQAIQKLKKSNHIN